VTSTGCPLDDRIRFSQPPVFGFAIEYSDSAASLRYYEPDFVAVLEDGGRRLIETKGRKDPDVAHKDRGARLWCENATQLTGREWRYLKVRVRPAPARGVWRPGGIRGGRVTAPTGPRRPPG